MYNEDTMKKKLHEQEEPVISKIEIDEDTSEPVLVEVPLDEIPETEEVLSPQDGKTLSSLPGARKSL